MHAEATPDRRTSEHRPLLLKTDEVAAALQISPQMVRRLVADGALTPVRLVNERSPYRFRPADVDELLERRKVQA